MIPTYGYGRGDGTGLIATYGYGGSFVFAPFVVDIITLTLELCRTLTFRAEL